MTYLWLVFALLSAITAALVGIFGKIGLKDIDSSTATAVRGVIMAIFLILVVIVQGKLGNIPQILGNNKALLYIVLSGLAGALSWLFYFWALKLGKVSQVVPIDRLSIVFALVLASIFLGEAAGIKGWVGGGLILVGALVIALG